MHNKFFPFLFVVFVSLNAANAQTQVECGTPNKQSWFNILKAKQPAAVQRGGQLAIIPFQIHLFQASNGSSNITLAEIYAEIDSVNHFYENAGMVFIECVAPQIINDDYYFDFLL